MKCGLITFLIRTGDAKNRLSGRIHAGRRGPLNRSKRQDPFDFQVIKWLNVMPILLRKLRKYADLALHGTILGIFLKFIFMRREKLLRFIRVPIRTRGVSDGIIERIQCYVSIYSNIFRTFGFRDTCLARSFLLCRALRENGIEAFVRFGVREADACDGQMPDDWKTVGHCWVTVSGGEQIPHNFPLVVTCP